MGRLDDARRELREMSADGFRMFPRDPAWMSAMVSLAGMRAEVEGAVPAGENAFRREGQFWTVRFGGATFRLKDTKGMRYIAALLVRPGVEVHVMELVAAGEGTAAVSSAARREVAEGALTVDEGAGDDVLDERAKAEFRGRLDELRDELEEAERWGDTERASRARWEIDAIADQLAAG